MEPVKKVEIEDATPPDMKATNEAFDEIAEALDAWLKGCKEKGVPPSRAHHMLLKIACYLVADAFIRNHVSEKETRSAMGNLLEEAIESAVADYTSKARD